MEEFFFLLIDRLLVLASLTVLASGKDPEMFVSNQGWLFSLLLCSPVALVMIAIIEEKIRARS
jgi:hypothetical protein